MCSWLDRDVLQGRRGGPAVKVEELPLLLTVDEAAEVLRIEASLCQGEVLRGVMAGAWQRLRCRGDDVGVVVGVA